jgi:hypothetical protein
MSDRAVKRRGLNRPSDAPSGRGAEIAVLESQVEELRSQSASLATRNAALDLRLANATVELDALRAADAGECAELRERIKALTEHLDSADRHVASMRSRLDQLTMESTRRIARLENQLRERELHFAGEIKRLKDARASETEKLQRRIEELIEANRRLATETKESNSAAARQRHSLENRVASLLNDIDEMKQRDAEAIGDRDRVITGLRHDIENTKSVAAAEKAHLRQNLADAETTHHREAAQHAKLMENLKTTVATLEREALSASEAMMGDRRRFEAAIADERDRARHQIDARDEQRRKIEARAEAAEKQAAGALATATKEITRANQLEVRLNAERTSRGDEIEALQQQNAALTAQREADHNSTTLIIDELRVRLAEVAGEDAASTAVAAARIRLEERDSEVELLRGRIAELEAERAAVTEPDVGDDEDDQVQDEPVDGARAQITEVMDYARTLEEQLGEVQQRRNEASVEQVGKAAEEPSPSWRRQLFGSRVVSSRRA